MRVSWPWKPRPPGSTFYPTGIKLVFFCTKFILKEKETNNCRCPGDFPEKSPVNQIAWTSFGALSLTIVINPTNTPTYRTNGPIPDVIKQKDFPVSRNRGRRDTVFDMTSKMDTVR